MGAYLGRIPDAEVLEHETNAWTAHRNFIDSHININWQFTIKDARIKLKSLYSVFS